MVIQGSGPIPGAAYKPPTYSRSPNIHTLGSLPPASSPGCEIVKVLQATAREHTALVNLQQKEVEDLNKKMAEIERGQDALDRENAALRRRIIQLKKIAGCALGVVTGLGLLAADSGVSTYQIILHSVIGGAVGTLMVSEHNRKKEV